MTIGAIFEIITTFWRGALSFLFGADSKVTRNAGWVLLAVVAGAVLIGYVVVQSYFSPSDLERGIEDRKPEIIQQQAETDAGHETTERRAADADKATRSTREAEKRTTEARNAQNKAIKTDVNGISYEQANAERCKAFPESSECAK
jgi:hypothetical protein